MSDDLSEKLTDAFEHTDYDLVTASRNRDQVRVAVLPAGADPDALRAIIEEALDADALLGFTVTSETVDANDTIGTVATFRRRD